MAKNKAKKGATAPKVETKAAEEVKVQAAVETKVEDKAPKKPAPQPDVQPKADTKEQKKPDPTPAAAPAEGATGDQPAVVQPEKVNNAAMPTQAEMSAEVFKNAELQSILGSISLTPESTMDANHMVLLTHVATERFKGKDPKNPVVIAANEMVDDLTCYCIAVAGINMAINGKKLGMSVPVNALGAYVRAMGYFGIALPAEKAVPDPNKPDQLLIPFEGASPETVETVKEEIKMQRGTKPTMDPALWKSDEDAKKALLYILSDTLSKDNRFLVSTSKLRMYKMLSAENKEEKTMWESASNATIFDNLLSILGTAKSTFLNAIGGQIYSSAATQKNPIKSHLTLKRNFPQLSDEDAAEIIKIIVKHKAAQNNPNEPLENNIAWNGLKDGKREDCLLYPTKTTDVDKEIMGRLQNVYAERLGSPAEAGYNLRATNLIVTIMNLYKTSGQIAQLVEQNYTAEVNKALEATSGKTAPQEEKKDEKEAEKPKK